MKIQFKRLAFLGTVGVIAILSAAIPPTSMATSIDLTNLPVLSKAFLAPGSDPSVLPGPIAIADEGNDRIIIVDPKGRLRWEYPQKGDLLPGQIFRTPDDVFFSPDGKSLVVTESDNKTISVIDIATRKITFQYGVAEVGSSKVGYLDNPDDAMLLKDGHIIVADIKNCRVLLLNPKTNSQSQLGKTGRCVHSLGKTYGSPNGAFPMSNGRFLVTEINGDWVDEIDLNGKVYWATHPPGVLYPSDSNQVSDNVFLTVDFVKPGQIVEFNSKGKLLWRYKPTGSKALNHPSLAHALPNCDVIATDDANHRIIVVDPKTNKIVWQYGRKGLAGRSNGLINNPDGLDLLPPYSLAMTSGG